VVIGSLGYLGGPACGGCLFIFFEENLRSIRSFFGLSNRILDGDFGLRVSNEQRAMPGVVQLSFPQLSRLTNKAQHGTRSLCNVE
jgi:hypothetical protein